MVKPSLQHRRATPVRLLVSVLGVAVAGALLARATPPLAAQTPPPARSEAVGTQPEALVRLADEVAKEVEVLRGWSFKQPVAKRLATPEQAREYVERQLTTTLPAHEMALVEAMLRTIGLIPPTCSLEGTFLRLMESQIAGFYDPETRALNIVQRPGTMPAIVERMMLAHELTHALDDQYVDLAALIKPTSASTEDSDLVVSSVSEGSATGLMLQYMVRAQAAGRVNLQELSQYAAQEAERSKLFLEAPRYFTSVLASYICGMQFLAKGDLMALVTAPDNRAMGQNLLAARKDIPRSTEQILHPAKYWDPSQRDEPVRIDDLAVEKWLAQSGRWVVRKDTIGELLVAILTAPKDKPPDPASLMTADAWTTPVARGWGGDRFFLLSTGASAAEATVALQNLRGVWITAWDTPVDRDEFTASLTASSMPSSAAVAPMGPVGAVVFVGFDAAERASLIERLGSTSLTVARGGKDRQSTSRLRESGWPFACARSLY